MSESSTYIPRAGSLPWRILTWMVLNPNEELNRRDIAFKFETQSSGVDAVLGIAVARNVIKRTRNSEMEVVWSLGKSADFVLEQATCDQVADAPPRTSHPLRQPAPITVLDLDMIKVRKGVRLLSPEERRRQEFIEWFDQFDIGDSAEFDDEHVQTIRTESTRHRKLKHSAWKIAVTGPGRSGIERTA